MLIRYKSYIFILTFAYVGIFDLKTLEMTEGDLPKRAQEMVRDWMKQNQNELLDMWNSQNLRKLPPL